MVNGFHRLGHDTVVGSYDQNGDVGCPGATGPNGGESLVARCVQKGHRVAVVLHLVGAYVLGDTADLLVGYFGLANSV